MPDTVRAGSSEHPVGMPLSELAYRTLRDRILRCEIEPGEKLKIDMLQREHGFSSSPLREALNRLVTEGLVQADERRGFRAATVSGDDLMDVTRLRLLLDVEALMESMRVGDDAWEARIVSAQHWLARIEERAAEAGANTPLTLNAEWSVRHKDFHMALLSASASPKLLLMCSNLFDQAERYRRLSMRHRKEPRHKAAEHRRIMDAVLRRDHAAARSLLCDHISRTADNVLAALERLAREGTARSIDCRMPARRAAAERL
ncbi:MAG: FCD domain-containing protein [Burkholderiales bacterium]|nr:FCD domain-containing protein [Burkholderiales bacterium]